MGFGFDLLGELYDWLELRVVLLLLLRVWIEGVDKVSYSGVADKLWKWYRQRERHGQPALPNEETKRKETDEPVETERKGRGTHRVDRFRCFRHTGSKAVVKPSAQSKKMFQRLSCRAGTLL